MITREFEYSAEMGEEKGTIYMRLHTPEENADGDWTCRLELVFPDEKMDKTIFGVDGLQALLLATKMAKALLLFYSKTHKLKITWLEMDDLGMDLQ